MNTPFSLSYNVNVLNPRYESQINSLSAKMEAFFSTRTGFSDICKDIESDTTIIGAMVISGSDDTDKKSSVKRAITSALKDLIEDCQIQSNAIEVYCVVTIGNIAQPFTFKAI